MQSQSRSKRFLRKKKKGGESGREGRKRWREGGRKGGRREENIFKKEAKRKESTWILNYESQRKKQFFFRNRIREHIQKMEYSREKK